MPSFVDQTGRTIQLDKTPQRIVSLVPSQTELLHSLGLTHEVVGITKFCVHPDEWFHSKMKVGGTKQVKLNIIHELKPDLIIANKEENVREQIEELESHYPVWVSDVNKLDDAYSMIYSIGNIVGKLASACRWISGIGYNFTQTKKPARKLSAAYLIWKEPYITVGGDTFIHSMLNIAGFENTFASKTRYPELTVAELQTQNPELILLSSEPFPFKQKHIDELQPFLPGTKIVLVNGEMFSWYGSRMRQAAEYFQKLNDDIHRMMID